MPARAVDGLEPYALFMFCGILPWTWFSSSLLESSNVLICRRQPDSQGAVPGGSAADRHGARRRSCTSASACRSSPAFLVYYRRRRRRWSDLLWLPVIVLVQLMLTLGLALLVSALTVHFRDVRDLLANLLTLWFFATPIIYPLAQACRNALQRWSEAESRSRTGRGLSGSAVPARPVHRAWRSAAASARSRWRFC